MDVYRVLNWYESNSKFTKGLLSALRSKKCFQTIRLGSTWADRLNPGQKIAISISDNSQKPNIIGHAHVWAVRKVILCSLTKRDLNKSIAAREWAQVLENMQSVYGASEVQSDSIVSVIELLGA